MKELRFQRWAGTRSLTVARMLTGETLSGRPWRRVACIPNRDWGSQWGAREGIVTRNVSLAGFGGYVYPRCCIMVLDMYMWN
jgi:hypothetical protein